MPNSNPCTVECQAIWTGKSKTHAPGEKCKHRATRKIEIEKPFRLSLLTCSYHADQTAKLHPGATLTITDFPPKPAQPKGD